MRRFLDHFNTTLIIVLMIVMVLSALLQVFARVVDLNTPFTEELTIFSMMWVALFGSSYAFGVKKHIAIDLISPSLSEVNRKRLRVLVEGIVLAFAITILIWGGTQLVWVTFKLGQVSSVMHVPKGWIYLALPLSGIVIVLYGILNIKEIFKQEISA